MNVSPFDPEAARSAWFPICAADDLPFRHVFHARLLGRELAVWRADDGHVNVWENRCLHRGVRLSIGVNDGAELVCRYHGWRYANRSAGCTYIPAHPANAPARRICNTVHPVRERHGLVWSGESPVGEPPSLDVFGGELGGAFGAASGDGAGVGLDVGNGGGNGGGADAVSTVDVDGGSHARPMLALRAVPVNASIALVHAALAEVVSERDDRGDIHDDEDGDEDGDGVRGRDDVGDVDDGDEEGVCDDDGRDATRYLLQPLDAGRTVIRALVPDPGDPVRALALLRARDRAFDAFRRHVEARARAEPRPAPFHVVPSRVSEALVELPEASASGRVAPLRLRLVRRRELARDIVAFDFSALGAGGTVGPPPTAAPGSHVDLHLPDGLVRQYSLTGGPDESASWSVAVQRASDSRGGSRWLHEHLREGDVLAASVAHNGFPLRRDASETLLIAGGIGITALVSMAKTLHRASLPFELLYLARDADHLAFGDTLDAMGEHVTRLTGLTPADTRARIETALGPHAHGRHVYVCGPPALIDATRTLASANGWPDDAVHVEHFGNERELSRESTFEIALARSGVTLAVRTGETILEVLRAHGVAMPSSCEQGACGTCRVAVLDGVPDHQDVHLSETEKAAGNTVMVCVSRARGERLVLDL